ncbi:cytochrome c [Marinovum sp.]|uniref:cytochrome c n=1 Tax=Marinovum sp. TaxID=2024839 RepID=UPI002B26FA84|nr:cytochrome c [Marinovum sp.]
MKLTRPQALGLAALTAVTALAACKPNEMPQAEDGRRLFVENCALCHGHGGAGDGPLADGLKPAPADLTRISARNAGSFPRAEVLSTLDGYTRVDLPGTGMPEFGALLRGDLVPVDVGDGRLTPTPRRLVALMEYLESIQD